jgi:hypothetical protein
MIIWNHGGLDLIEWLERPTINAKVATVLSPNLTFKGAQESIPSLADSISGLLKLLQILAMGSIPASSDTVESEGRPKKQCL